MPSPGLECADRLSPSEVGGCDAVGAAAAAQLLYRGVHIVQGGEGRLQVHCRSGQVRSGQVRSAQVNSFIWSVGSVIHSFIHPCRQSVSTKQKIAGM